MKVLILGPNGLVGSTITKFFINKPKYQTYGFVTDISRRVLFNKKFEENFYLIKNFFDFEELEGKIKVIAPNIVINCLGMTNKVQNKNKSINLIENYIKINSLLPHKLYEICSRYDIRLIHLSTDCVFSGKKGFYSESDLPDPQDIYGRSKLLGELDYKNCITLRKSVIGHEFFTKNGLLEWFLDQKDKVEGYKNVTFSGLTVLELANIIENHIIPNNSLEGILHLSGPSISKYDLLKIVSKIYDKSIDINLNKTIKVDRTLNSSKFNKLTGYKMKSWPILIKSMHDFNQLNI